MGDMKDFKDYGLNEDHLRNNILLDVIKEVCNDTNYKLSLKLAGKVKRIMMDCELALFSSLHKLNTADESTSNVLGVMHQFTTEMTFDEQTELNQAIINKIQHKIPILTTECETLHQSIKGKQKSRQDELKELQNSLDEKLDILKEQENRKAELMMEWLDYRINEVSTFSTNSSEVLSLKTKILELKSKILHLQILRNIFTETNQSIKAYCEIHKDLKHSIKETEQSIKHFKHIIESDFS